MLIKTCIKNCKKWPKNWTFSRELTFPSATKSNISRFQTVTTLPKNCKIAKLCFAKVSYFKVSNKTSFKAYVSVTNKVIYCFPLIKENVWISFKNILASLPSIQVSDIKRNVSSLVINNNFSYIEISQLICPAKQMAGTLVGTLSAMRVFHDILWTVIIRASLNSCF